MTMPPNQGPWPDPTGAPPPPGWPTPTTPGAPPADPATTPFYQTQPPSYAVPGYGTPGYVARRPTNGLALAAMICSLAGFMTVISWPVGAVLGHIALRKVRETGEEGEAFAWVGIIVGWVGTALIALGCVGIVVLLTSLNNGQPISD